MKGDLVKLAFHEEKAETVKNSAFSKNILEGEKLKGGNPWREVKLMVLTRKENNNNSLSTKHFP